ncbi:hypothetical protein F3J29_12790 [Enterobacter sp. Cy-643]|uniref:hypothetical protein n=1 Tax=Enterobacter sp. Cy-643 TaxID=2608346 RepID=UPI00141DD358|nr:hypothetical protein [Enterobacter sp. Cy-643]NIF33007.1 hypothetical protein [Enterobacter sp. Cy-643]
MADLIGISFESSTWANTWSEIPFGVTARVVDAESLLPQREIAVRMEVDTAVGVWIGSNSNIINLETNYEGAATAKIKFKAGVPQVVSIKVSKIETSGQASVTKTDSVFMVSPTLRNHTFPIATDGRVTEADVAAGVYAIVPIASPEVGNVVGFHFGDNAVLKQSEQSSAINSIAVSVPESYLTSGTHASAFYITDNSGNSSFSNIVELEVVRDSSSATIVDLPPVSIPRADSNNLTINVALAATGVEVQLDGLYEGKVVNAAAREDSICNIYWKSYRGAVEIPAASRVFSFPVDPEGAENSIIVLDDDYNDEGNALRDLLYALGEGTIKISYEMVIEKDQKLHASTEKTYYVDVVPPTKK